MTACARFPYISQEFAEWAVKRFEGSVTVVADRDSILLASQTNNRYVEVACLAEMPTAAAVDEVPSPATAGWYTLELPLHRAGHDVARCDWPLGVLKAYMEAHPA